MPLTKVSMEIQQGNNFQSMEVDKEETKPIEVKKLEAMLNEVFEQDDFIKFKEKFEIFNHAKLEYRHGFIKRLSDAFENFKSDQFDESLKTCFQDQKILVKLDEKSSSHS